MSLYLVVSHALVTGSLFAGPSDVLLWLELALLQRCE